MTVNAAQLQKILGDNAFRLTPATLAVRMSRGKWLPAKHLLYLSQIIAYELNKGNARIIISMPPRHGKSKLGSVRTPVWQFDRFPDRLIGVTSYGADLAEGFSEEVRDIIIEDNDVEHGQHLLNVDLKTTKINNWSTTEGGRMYAVGVGGTLYGRGVHDLLVDDYYKNPEEAESQSYRDKVFEWFGVIAATRIEPGGNIIIIATRWNTDDLSGRLLAMPDSPWREIRIPGLAEENDVLGRQPGEALWPQRYDEKALLGWKATMGSYFFDAIVQQKPRKSRSQVFQEQWVAQIDALGTEFDPNNPEVLCLRAWDLAGTDAGGDYTSGTLLYANRKKGTVCIADQIREQLAPGGVEELVKATADADHRKVNITMEQEPGSSGKAVMATYKAILRGYHMTAIRDTGSKFIKAQPFLAACERGAVKVLRGPWNSLWYDEFSAFPDGENDDQVDSTSQGYNKLFGVKQRAGTFGRLLAGSQGTIIVPNKHNSLIIPGKTNLLLPNGVTKKSPGMFSATWGRR